MAVINTNITALIAQQNLGRSQNMLQTSMERLSSGLRINSAADDAAGQAIANRMSAQITGLSQAQRNANDGISVSQTAEGALNQMNDNLQRIRQLTVQAANGTNSSSDLSSIQDEINERLAEVDRVSEQTSFNGVQVLAKDQGLNIQVGANDGETITLNLKQIDANTLGLSDFHVNQGVDTAKVGGTQASARVGADQTVDIQADGNSTPKTADGLYATSDGTGYVVKASDGTYYSATVNAASSGAVTVDWDSTTTSVAASTVDTTASFSTLKENVSLTAANGGDTVVQYSGDNLGDYIIKSSTGSYYAANADEAGNVTRGAELSTDADATTNPLQKLDDALSQVDSLRSMLGAAQNRFESAITNLGTTTTNLSAARSRIEDADYAVEVSNMTRSQILQQAGTAVLSQANQAPQSVLSLLR